MFDQLRKQAEKILRRRSHYRAAFATPAGRAVLEDLERFCRAASSSVIVSPITGSIDTHAMAVNEGRREVYLRIRAHLANEDAQPAETNEEQYDD